MDFPAWIVAAIVGWGVYAWYTQRAASAVTPDVPPESPADDDEFASLMPPSDMHASAPWDLFWQNQLKLQVVGFTDLFVDDRHLIDMMHARGFTRVLCVGAGLSIEPHALAAAGLTVTVLDISTFVAEAMRGAMIPPEALDRFVDASQRRPGGSVECVAGDLTDASVCPGPYDLVVERKTLQLFRDGERAAALAAVASRLTPTGMLFSHCHDGSWRPGRDRTHWVEPLLVPAGFTIGRMESGTWSPTGRTAFTFLSTG